jgi:hypothetical protein
MTRSLLLAALILAALAGRAAAESVPLPLGDRVLQAVGTPDGSVLLVRGESTGPYTSPDAALTIQRVTGATAATTATRAGSALVAFRPTSDGSADLLAFSTRQGGRLTLLHLAPDGRLSRRWTSPAGAGTAADVARDARGRVVVAWTQRGRVRVVRSADGRTFSAPRTVRASARSIASVAWVAAAIDRSGRPVLVATRVGRTPATDVLTLDRLGRALRRATLAVQGIPQTTQTAGGRIGIVVHDTGIEGEEGECVSDGRPRHVWATAIEPHGSRPHKPAELARQRAYCPSGGAPYLLAGPRNQLLVVVGAIPDAQPTPRASISWSAPGHGFAVPYRVWGETLLAGAAVDPRDGSVIAALQQPDNANGHGVALHRRTPAGTLPAPQVLTATGELQTLSVDAAGRTLAVTSDPTAGPVLTIDAGAS